MAFDDTVFSEDFEGATYTPIPFDGSVFNQNIFTTTLVEQAFQDDAFSADAFQAEKKPEVKPPCGHSMGRGYSPEIFHSDGVIIIDSIGGADGSGYSLENVYSTDGAVRIGGSGLAWGEGLSPMVRGLFISGAGTEANPYLIYHISDMEAIGTSPYTLDKWYKLANDIDMTDTQRSNYNSGAGFNTFSSWLGNFNGDNKKLIGLYINKPGTDKVALFNKEAIAGYPGATVRNVIFENPEIIGKDTVGVVSAYTYQFNISNCHVTGGKVTGNSNVGGLSGSFTRGYDIKDSSYEGEINATGNNVGGIVGVMDNASYEQTQVDNCEVEVEINATGSTIGGICGWGECNLKNIDIGEDDVIINAGTTSDNIGGIVGNLTAYWANKSYIYDCSIDGLTVNSGRNNIGGAIGTGFRYAKGYNLTLNNITLLGADSVGGILGSYDGDGRGYDALGDSTISNSDIRGVNYIGGIVGYLGRTYLHDCLIKDSTIYGTGTRIGGAVGHNQWGSTIEDVTVKRCTITGATDHVAGVVAYHWRGGAVTRCNLILSEVNGRDYVSGFSGYHDSYYGDGFVTVSGCRATYSVINGSRDYVGGGCCVSYSQTTTKCLFQGTVYGRHYVGGLIGRAGGEVTKSFSTGNLVATGNYIGGLVGEMASSSTFNDNGSMVNIRYGVDRVGGLIGSHSGGNITRCYSGGVIFDAETNIGGMVGYKSSTQTSDYCYWDTENSGYPTSAMGVGKTHSEMLTQGTYETWDFATPIWMMPGDCINIGYPYPADAQMLPGNSGYICIDSIGEALGGEGYSPSVMVMYPIKPDGIPSAEAFGTALIKLKSIPYGIPSAEAFGTPLLIQEQFLTPQGIISSESSGIPQLNFKIYIGGVSSEEDFGTPVMGISLLVEGIPSDEALGNPTLNFIIHSNWGSGGEEFGNLKLLLYLLVNAIASEEALGTPNVVRLLKPGGIESLEYFGSPQLNMIIKSLWGSGGEEFGILKMIMYLQAEGFWDETAVPGMPKIKLYVKPLGILSEEYVSSGINLAFDQWIVTLGIPGAEGFGIALMIIEQFLNPEGIVSEETIGMHWIYNFYELVYADFNILNPVTDFDIMNDKADLEMKVPNPSIIMHPPKATFKVLQPITSFKFIE